MEKDSVEFPTDSSVEQKEDQKPQRTSDFYKTKNLPERFDIPDLLQGYDNKPQHPMYRTSSAVYGSQPPSVHTMPTEFHGKCQKFSKNLGKFGMFRNHSLNTAQDRSRV